MPSGTGKTISLLSLIVAYQRVSLPRGVLGFQAILTSTFEHVRLFYSGLSFGRHQVNLLLQNSSGDREGESDQTKRKV